MRFGFTHRRTSHRSIPCTLPVSRSQNHKYCSIFFFWFACISSFQLLFLICFSHIKLTNRFIYNHYPRVISSSFWLVCIRNWTRKWFEPWCNSILRYALTPTDMCVCLLSYCLFIGIYFMFIESCLRGMKRALFGIFQSNLLPPIMRDSRTSLTVHSDFLYRKQLLTFYIGYS